MTASLPPALDAECLHFDGLACYVAGEGPPLLLVHSVNAAASAAEVKPLFDHFRATHTVFAPDLPGFGLSERSDRVYTQRLMTDALHAVAAQVHKRCGAVPIDALAVSLACEFLARAAVEQPDPWGRLALVSPTGLRGSQSKRGAPGSTRELPGFHRVLSVPLWSDALFRGLTKPKVVRFFLEKTWGGKAIDDALCDYCVQSARMPGARFAPLYFLSGGLFSADILDLYEALTVQVWLSHGIRGDFTDYRGKSLLEGRSNWQFTVFPTGALPYFEVRDEFARRLTTFLSGGVVTG